MHPFFADCFDRLEELHHDMHHTLEGLPSEALDWNPGPEMNSLAILASHTAGAERYWMGDVIAADSSDRHRPDEFQTTGISAATLQNQLATVLAYSKTILSQLTLEELTRVCSSPNHPDHTFTVGWSLAHTLEHTAVHLGHMQILRQLWNQQQGTSS